VVKGWHGAKNQDWDSKKIYVDIFSVFFYVVVQYDTHFSQCTQLCIFKTSDLSSKVARLNTHSVNPRGMAISFMAESHDKSIGNIHIEDNHKLHSVQLGSSNQISILSLSLQTLSCEHDPLSFEVGYGQNVDRNYSMSILGCCFLGGQATSSQEGETQRE